MHESVKLGTIGDAYPSLNWRVQARLAGLNEPDRGYVEQPGEKPPEPPPTTRRPAPNLIPMRAIEREKEKSANETAPKPPPPAPEPLPPPSETERVESKEPAPRATRPYRHWSQETKDIIARRYLAGEASQGELAIEYGTHQTTISRFVLEHSSRQNGTWGAAEMAGKKKAKKAAKTSALSTEEKLAAVQRALALGKGGKAKVARELGVHESNVSNWSRGISLGAFGNKNARATEAQFRDTVVSSAPGGPPSQRGALSTEEKLAAVEEAKALGQGGFNQVAVRLGVDPASLRNWSQGKYLGTASSNGAAPPSATISAPRSRRMPKAPPLIAAMPGFEEYLTALIQRVAEESVMAFMAKKFGVR